MDAFLDDRIDGVGVSRQNTLQLRYLGFVHLVELRICDSVTIYNNDEGSGILDVSLPVVEAVVQEFSQTSSRHCSAWSG